MNENKFPNDPNHTPDEVSSDADPLSENLSRMLTDVQLPRIDEQTAQKILAELELKQQQLYSSEESTMASPASLSVRGNESRASRSWNSFGWVAISTVLALSVVFGLAVRSYLSQPNGTSDQKSIATGGPEKKEKGKIEPTGDQNLIGAHQPSELIRQVFEDGTVLIAQAGSIYSVESLRKISLKAGEIYLIVAKKNEPFVVETAEGEVRATGTRFYVSADRTAKNTTAAVAQGTVELDSKTGQVELQAGEQGTMAAGEKPTRQPAPRLSYLVNWARDALAQQDLLVEKPEQENGLVAVDPWGQESKLSLRQYNVDIYIEDGIARTTIDQTFFNHNPWNTEGTFYFPLPRDASVSRLAMYVAGTLNEGGMVSRERGQQIYNEIRYQQRDPALLEMMEGNMFKMRIFPLEGRQEKRIFLSYTQKLDELYGTMRYWFPMDHTNSVAGQLSINVRVKNGAKAFDPQSSTHAVNTSIDGDDLLIRYDDEKIKPDQDFLLHLLPTAEVPETRVATCEKDGQHYLFARIQPKLKGEVGGKPRQWFVLNDVSASRSKIEATAQRYILQRLIEEADDHDTIFLIDLNTRAMPVSSKPVNVRSPQASLLAEHQATNVGACNIASGIAEVKRQISAHKATNPHIVLLGDGVATDGERDMAKLPDLLSRDVPFIGIGVGKSVDGLFMQTAADKTSGLFATINPDEDIDWRVFDLVAALNTPRMNKIDILLFDENDKPVKAIAYPSSRGLSAGETLTVVARYDAAMPSELVFRGEVNGKKIALASKLKDAKVGAQFIPRLWAKRHIDELLKSDMPREEEIVELSKQYYVVTPYTSLIVLENDAMYEQYGVERGRKDHWALYDAPKQIEVVREEIDWSRYYWYGNRQGEDQKIQATTQPKTVQDIVDSMQIRINAPFYFYPPQGPRASRTNLYALAEQTVAKADADNQAEAAAADNQARLLTFWYLLAAGQYDAIQSSVATQTAPGQTDVQLSDVYEKKKSVMRPQLELMLPPAAAFFRSPRREMQFNFGLLGKEILMNRFARGGMQVDGTANTRMLWELPQLVAIGADDSGLAVFASTSFNTIRSTNASSSKRVPDQLVLSFQRAMQTRMSRINRDIENYNRQYQNWNWSGNNTNWWIYNDYGIDLRNATRAYWNDGLESLLDIADRESMKGGQSLLPIWLDVDGTSIDGFISELRTDLRLDGGFYYESFGNRAFGGGGFGGQPPQLMQMGFVPVQMGFDVDLYASFIPPRAALISALQSAVNQPAMVSVIAADYLGKRRAELSEKQLDEKGTRELQAIETALANIESAAARLEDSAPFWSGGWGYQPQISYYQAPQVQAWNGYSWSFDLTQYVDGFYTTEADILNEVAKSFGTVKPRGTVSEDARSRIEAARRAVGSVRINFAPARDDADQSAKDETSGDYPELLVAAGDRFAMTSRNEMYLTQRLVCDGKSIWQVYDELGLASRRTASPMRLESLRASVPHLLEPADAMAMFHNVDLIAEDDNGFTLKLTPVEPEANGDKADGQASKSDDAAKESAAKKSEVWMTVRLDNTGRVLERALFVDGTSELQVKFDYESQPDRVSIVWIDKDAKELAKTSYGVRAERFSATTFAVQQKDLVVIDMPLRKSEYYAEKLTELDDDQPEEQVRLQRHQALAAIQDLDWRRWGQENQAAKALMLAAIKSQAERGEQLKLGDVVLLGSAGSYAVPTLLENYLSKKEIEIDLNEVRHVYQDSPVVKFFENVRNSGWNKGHENFKDEKGLVGHLAAYLTANSFATNDQFYQFFESGFGDSPLLLTLACQRVAHTQKIDAVLDLNKRPQWSGLALLMSLQYMQQTAEQKQHFAKEFWRSRDEFKKSEWYKAGYDVMLNAQFAAVLNEVDADKVRAMMDERFEKVKASDSLPVLLNFAEQAYHWGQAEFADAALKLAEAKLGDEVTLVSRLAMGQAYWTCGKHQQALAKYESILQSLQEKKIAASPALLATASRIASQAGNNKRAIELEEQALMIEQKYLPQMINLNAFNQRYNWLWSQYQQAIETAKAADDKQEIKSITARAYETWLRWQEVDRDNLQQPTYIATLLKSAGADDQEIWNSLSTAIDRKPRDAASYATVANWYQQHQDLNKAEEFLEEAYRWDTANPQWLFQRAELLRQLNRNPEAIALYKQIIDGQWAPALQGWIQQSQVKLNELN